MAKKTAKATGHDITSIQQVYTQLNTVTRQFADLNTASTIQPLHQKSSGTEILHAFLNAKVSTALRLQLEVSAIE